MAKYLHIPGVSGQAPSAPDIAAYNLNDTFFLAAYVALDDWTPSTATAIIGQFVSSGNQRAYMLKINTTGTIQFRGGNNGTVNEAVDSDSATSYVDGTAHWIGCNFNGGVVQFFEGGTDLGNPSWVQFGTDETMATATSCHDSTGTLEIGTQDVGTNALLGGQVYRAIMYSDLLRTTTVFDADFTKLSKADVEAGTFTESSSNAATVTLNGDEWTYVDTVTAGVLGRAEALYQASDLYAEGSPKWPDRSGNDHHAQHGSAGGADTNDPKFLPYSGTQYLYTT